MPPGATKCKKSGVFKNKIKPKFAPNALHPHFDNAILGAHVLAPKHVYLLN